MNEDELYVATEDPKLSLKTTEGENVAGQKDLG